MAKITVAAGAAFTEITDGGAPVSFFQFQNTGVHPLIIVYAAAQPTSGADGVRFRPGEGDRPSDGGTLLRAWARCEHPAIDPGQVSSSQD